MGVLRCLIHNPRQGPLMAGCPFRYQTCWLLLFALLLLPSCSRTKTISEKYLTDSQIIGKSREELIRVYGWPDFIAKNVEYKAKAGPPKVAAEQWEYRRLVKDERGGSFFLEICCDRDGKAIYYDLRPI